MLRHLPDCKLPTGVVLVCEMSLVVFLWSDSEWGIFLNHDFFSPLKFTASEFLIHIDMKHAFPWWIFIQISLQERGLQLEKTHLNFFEVLQSEKLFDYMSPLTDK